MTRKEAAQILDISEFADEKQIKKAFRNKAMVLHPDKNDAEDARAQFIRIHEAYEYLSDLASGRSSEKYTQKQSASYSSAQGPKFRSPYHKHRNYSDPYSSMSREEFEARYKRAQKAAEEAMDRESETIYQNSLDEYQNTWRKKLVIVMALIGIVLSILFTIDYFLGTTVETVPHSDVKTLTINDGSDIFEYLNIHHIKYELSGENLRIAMDPMTKIEITQTHIFKDITKIKISRNGYFMILEPTFSSYDSFPLVPLFLLIPFLSLFLERPKFNFVFLVVNFNIYVFPILLIILMFHDGRLLRLFGL